MRLAYFFYTMGFALMLVGCGDNARLPVSAGYGPDPALPQPDAPLIPTVNIAPAKGWPDGGKPEPAAGLGVSAFATGLDHPRWLYVLPNGDVLVAETNRPPKKDIGLKERVVQWFMARAGAGGESADRITLLRDSDNDGIADQQFVFLEDLHSPFGMALIEDDFYVANTDAVMRFPYEPGQSRITSPGVKVADLPAGPINQHWTKSLIASPEGKLYVGVGSNSNVAENGMDNEVGRAAVWEVDPATGEHRIFANGLRNPVGMAWAPGSGELWVAVNERDLLGSDLVPDYMTSLKEGGFYGWPYSYFGDHRDDRVKPARPDLVERAITPDYALGPHTASLGLASAEGNDLPSTFSQGMFVGQHGSWNRKPHSGYKVIFVPFNDGQPSGDPTDVLTGFLGEEDKALGRPVGVAIDQSGALLVADDVGNIVWRVHRKNAAGQP
ncbi:PQQ-dependent sugar dehydrogenase [Hydrocarboniclastica marina]|uniref:Sorbosone dehydrogenase family protein n=1 Tax=Hydrocarboniclastica marina TaxID=2259620 RepID=A0A4P7XKA6_9ALTE|nr:sorbosone dehydrogenase family protein [Hydrocarboniclastica marina]MAM00385.1 sorbosone dehydrogenase [Alteromonadaceae bacterium]QCF27649.1 sorbosone dehydrogenase family protein [Hydrocarboniclastica marina]|tara:strand:+ start:746 stop:2065 length:1320 start_codon:yes stop_codon:yes gene_type:complete